MRYPRISKCAIVIGTLLTLSVSSPLLAESLVEAENDGHGITAYAHSSDDIVSMSIRIVGPDNFVFEDRVEDAVIDWVPEGELNDGLYTWEARMVTIEPGAPLREDVVVSKQATAHITDDANSANQGNTPEAVTSQQEGTAEKHSEVPLERLFEGHHKNVTIEKGAFRVRNGWIEPIKQEDETSYTGQPGVIGSIAGALIDFIFPSAHAADCASPCNVEDSTGDAEVALSADTGGAGPFNVELEVDASTQFFNIDTTGQGSPWFSTSLSAPEDSFHMSSTGDIGLGTATPTETLHISDIRPRIRLEDTDDAQTWYVKNSNAGRFEIGESTSGTNPFIIQPGAPDASLFVGAAGSVGVGTAPQTTMHVSSIDSSMRFRLDPAGSTWNLYPGVAGLWIEESDGGNTPVKFANTAPTNSLVVSSSGVGLGTPSPDKALHIEGTSPDPLAANNTMIRIENSSGTAESRRMLELVNNGSPLMVYRNTETGDIWSQNPVGGQFTITKGGTGQQEFQMDGGGNVTIAGSLTENSMRSSKTDFEQVDTQGILAKLQMLPIEEWSYKHSTNSRHLGPMAEDFHTAFGLGPDNGIAPRDLAGVALAAAKALKTENDLLRERLDRLEDQISGQ